ncbi:AraC family transcriptional regulator [Roseateles sp.]|uniref:AraC-like transcriptional regulator QhpR n=1 Tax=Roseateles sp. TaxID=1971397 RepID=UPI0039EAD091
MNRTIQVHLQGSTLLAPIPHTTVRVAALFGLAALVFAAGADFEVLLRHVGIDEGLLQDPEHRITFRQFVQVLDAAAALTGDDCLGLHLGTAQSFQVAGVLGYAVQASSDVRSQLALAARYMALHQDGATFELEVEGDIALLRYVVNDAHVTRHRHDAEATLALGINQWRSQTGQPYWAPSSVHFEHPAPPSEAEQELRRFFRCPVHFGESFDGMRFPAAFLETPIHSADPALHQILTRYADECLTRHNVPKTFAAQARRLITGGLGNGHATIDDVARKLAMPTRTLQRRLAEEGLQFGELVDHTRRELAAQYLGDRRLSLTDAAFLLGYSDLTAFHRAFRRWFNQTPLEYRRQLIPGET